MIELLHRMLPASIPLINDLRNLTADNVCLALNRQGIEYKFNKFEAVSGDWELEKSNTATDDEIFSLLDMRTAGHKGTLLICTEACTRYQLEPFVCEAEGLEEYIKNYDIEMFFDGDVIMLAAESRTLTLFHHSGGYAHVKL